MSDDRTKNWTMNSEDVIQLMSRVSELEDLLEEINSHLSQSWMTVGAVCHKINVALGKEVEGNGKD